MLKVATTLGEVKQAIRGNILMTYRLKFLKILGQTAFLFGVLSWFYGFIIQVTHPEFLTEPLSHLTLWLRVDTFTIVSFLVAILGFFVWRILNELE
jgi:hypothetical protein